MRSEATFVKHCRITSPRMPKGWHRKSTGLCKCGATRTNPKDAYCKGCRAAASALARARLREELHRLRAAAKSQQEAGT